MPIAWFSYLEVDGVGSMVVGGEWVAACGSLLCVGCICSVLGGLVLEVEVSLVAMSREATTEAYWFIWGRPVVEMRYLRNACDVRRMDGESNECVYNIFGIIITDELINCRVIERVKCNTLKCFHNSKWIIMKYFYIQYCF